MIIQIFLFALIDCFSNGILIIIQHQPFLYN
jgi:hypothetical protein